MKKTYKYILIVIILLTLIIAVFCNEIFNNNLFIQEVLLSISFLLTLIYILINKKLFFFLRPAWHKYLGVLGMLLGGWQVYKSNFFNSKFSVVLFFLLGTILVFSIFIKDKLNSEEL
ncbi:hypothetical protein ACFO3O_03640 [Dokdonia ponticola]|uniref:Uncharacterized protein n=1 Tax=Dokdonia ponticola TaxID=2041041 RepID=A0ABV9HT59_9FLAO